jgi:hypothetical protein
MPFPTNKKGSPHSIQWTISTQAFNPYILITFDDGGRINMIQSPLVLNHSQRYSHPRHLSMRKRKTHVSSAAMHQSWIPSPNSQQNERCSANSSVASPQPQPAYLHLSVSPYDPPCQQRPSPPTASAVSPQMSLAGPRASLIEEDRRWNFDSTRDGYVARNPRHSTRIVRCCFVEPKAAD